jgi:predicted metal-dependent peptidase
LGLSGALQMSAVAHEVMHCALDHMTRLNGRQPGRWNRACDFAINPMLEDAKMELGESWLNNPNFKGMSADEIYNLLPPDENDTGSPQDSILPGDPDPDIEDKVREDWSNAAGQAAKIAAEAGKLPGSMERFLKGNEKAQVDWRERLRNFVSAVAKNDYSWMRPQRHMMAQGLILPGLYSQSMGTVVAVSDDSGSVSNEVLDALAAEINAIGEAVAPEKIVHISCDAAINHVAEFAQGEPFKMVSKGGGGTDFRPPFDHVEKSGAAPDCLVYLTDGYGPFPDKPAPYPVLWVMTTDVVPPWGEHVRIEV